MNKKQWKNLIEWIICILIAFILAVLIKYFIATPTVVRQSSMYPTLKENQRLILNRWSRTTKQMPERGDIVTFEAPSEKKMSDETRQTLIAQYKNKSNNYLYNFSYYVLEINKESYIKRVIGLPNDRIEIKDGKVFVNGNEYSEPYSQDTVITESRNSCFEDFIVPENCIFAIGDNREGSKDCRDFGCIPMEKIEGIVLIRFWPLNLFGKV